MIRPAPSSWQRFVDRSFKELVSQEPLAFRDMKPSKVPADEGVYIITAVIGRREIPYYVGRSKNLRQRLYNNHLMGSLTNARLKKYLIASGECSDKKAAKKFIQQKCLARWLIESDIRKRGAIEGFVTGLLFPRHGIYEEH